MKVAVLLCVKGHFVCENHPYLVCALVIKNKSMLMSRYKTLPFCRYFTQAAVEVVYSSDCEADSYIVAEVKRLLTEGVPYVLVATQDGVLSDCVRGNDNAWTMTHVLLHKELLRVCVILCMYYWLDV